jgi:hypothetical protein
MMNIRYTDQTGQTRDLQDSDAINILSYFRRQIRGPLLTAQGTTLKLGGPTGAALVPLTHSLLFEKGGKLRTFDPDGTECDCARRATG